MTADSTTPVPLASKDAVVATTAAAAKAAAIVNRHESHLRSLVKAISWRTTGTIDTFILSLIITGSMKFAGTIAGTEVITKVLLYYFHERAWAMIPWGRKLT